MSRKKPNFLHQVNSKVIFKGEVYHVHSRSHRSGKRYRLWSHDMDSIIKPNGQQSSWIKECYLMKHFDFKKR